MTIIACFQEHGLVIVGEDDETGEDGENEREKASTNLTPKKALVSAEVASLLEQAGEGSLDVRIRRLIEDKNELTDKYRRLKLDLEEERTKSLFRDRVPSLTTPSSPNGFAGDASDWQCNHSNPLDSISIMFYSIAPHSLTHSLFS